MAALIRPCCLIWDYRRRRRVRNWRKAIEDNNIDRLFELIDANQVRVEDAKGMPPLHFATMRASEAAGAG